MPTNELSKTNTSKSLEISMNSTPLSLRFDSIQQLVLNDENMSPSDRRRLFKQSFRSLFELRKEQFKAAIEVDQIRLEALKRIARRHIAVQEDIITTEIRKEYVRFLREVRLHVELDQLEFLTEFAEQLMAFRKKLKAKKIDKMEKKRILDMSYNTFEQVADQLAELTADLVEKANPQRED